MKRHIMAFFAMLGLSAMCFAQVGINDLQGSGRTVLIDAVRYKNADDVARLLNQGADVNVRSSDGMSALLYACQGKVYNANGPVWSMEDSAASHALSVKIVQSLLTAGADANGGDKNGVTPLMYAQNYDDNLVGLLLAAHADVNKKDNQGYTALLRLAEKSSVTLGTREAALQQLLLENGADPAVKDTKGLTAFMLTCGLNNVGPDLVKAYLKNGADVSQRDSSGRTPLMRMAAAQYASLDSLKLLLAAGADINAQDNKGNTALMLALSITDGADPGRALLLIDQKSNLSLVNADGEDALHVLAQTPYYEDSDPAKNDYQVPVLDRMIAAGVKVNTVDNKGNTALHLFIEKAPVHAQPALRLLAAGADANIKNKDGQYGRYAIEGAFDAGVYDAQQGGLPADPELYAALLEKSTEIQFQSSGGAHKRGLLLGGAPFDWAIEHNYVDIVKLMLKRGMSVDSPNGDQYSDYSYPILEAAFSNQTDMVKFLIAQGADVNVKGRAHGYTPLMVACDKGNLEMAKALLKAKASLKAVPKGGQPALAFAVTSGNADLVKLLIANNASWDPNGTGNTTTILDCAVQASTFKADILSLLLAAKANVNPKGSSPLLSAVRGGNAPAVDLLIAAKADVNYLDPQHKETPLSAAKARKLEKIAAALVKAGAK
jgi:ankyrin repeat protein